MIEAFTHLRTRITTTTAEALLDCFATAVAERRLTTVSYYGFHTANILRKSEAARLAFGALTMVLPDGIAVIWSGPIFGTRLTIENRLNGDVLGPYLFRRAARERWRVFLIGSDAATIAAAVARITLMFPELILAGFHHGYAGGEDVRAVVVEVQRSRADILLVGMGQPYQEEWINANANDLGVPVVMAVGGYFDHLARRADCYPRLVSLLRLNWAYRLFTEPRRLWKRYLFGFPIYLLQLVLWLGPNNKRRLAQGR